MASTLACSARLRNREGVRQGVENREEQSGTELRGVWMITKKEGKREVDRE